MLGGARASPAVKTATLQRDSAALVAAVRQQLDERLSASPDLPEVRPWRRGQCQRCLHCVRATFVMEKSRRNSLAQTGHQRGSMHDVANVQQPATGLQRWCHFVQDVDLKVVARDARCGRLLSGAIPELEFCYRSKTCYLFVDVFQFLLQDADLEVVARGAGDCWVSARVDGRRSLTVVMEGRGEGGLQVTKLIG